MPPTAGGSLGDEAMLRAAIRGFRDVGAESIALVDLGGRPWSLPVDQLVSFHSCLKVTDDVYVKGFAQVAMFERFCLLGADVLDGKYSDERSALRVGMVRRASEVGVQAAILGFSFNDNPTPGVLQAFQTLNKEVSLFARDPVSHSRLEERLGRPVDQAADLAFLLEPDEGGKEYKRLRSWVRDQRASGRKILAFNANRIHAPKAGGIQVLIRAIIHSVEDLVRKRDWPVSVLLAPHDDRNEWNDVQIAEEVYTRIPEDLRVYVEMIRFPTTAPEVKAIASLVDAAITGRMHFAIACLGQGTPALGISYQGKFRGLYQLLNLENMTLDPERAYQDGTLVEAATGLLHRSDELRSAISQRIPTVHRLSRRNFQFPN